MPPTTSTSRIGLRPFGEVLLDVSQGDIEKRATAMLAEAVRAADATGKQATLTIKLKIAKTPKGIQIVGDVTSTVPREPLESTFFYVDDRGSLLKENPRQTTNGLETAAPTANPFKIASDSPANPGNQ